MRKPGEREWGEGSSKTGGELHFQYVFCELRKNKLPLICASSRLLHFVRRLVLSHSQSQSKFPFSSCCLFEYWANLVTVVSPALNN